MSLPIVYEVRKLKDAWAVCLHGTRIVSFGHCQRAVKIAEVIARHHFRVNGTPVKVCLVDGERVLELGPRGTTHAATWLRHVAALRDGRGVSSGPSTSLRRA